MHTAHSLPGAAEALHHLHAHHIPFLLLTNGGGRLERDRMADLAAKLGVPLGEENFVQSHTPFRELVSGQWDVGVQGGIGNRTVFVTGSHGDRCRTIMQSYVHVRNWKK